MHWTAADWTVLLVGSVSLVLIHMLLLRTLEHLIRDLATLPSELRAIAGESE